MEGDLYAAWLPENFYYFFHLTAWMIPVAAIQWGIGGRILLANRKAILLPTLLVGSYLIATDIVAVSLGIWYFDPNRILAGLVTDSTSAFASFLLAPFGVPIEEWLFFYLTSLLCAQSFILFLPQRHRHG